MTFRDEFNVCDEFRDEFAMRFQGHCVVVVHTEFGVGITSGSQKNHCEQAVAVIVSSFLVSGSNFALLACCSHMWRKKC